VRGVSLSTITLAVDNCRLLAPYNSFGRPARRRFDSLRFSLNKFWNCRSNLGWAGNWIFHSVTERWGYLFKLRGSGFQPLVPDISKQGNTLMGYLLGEAAQAAAVVMRPEASVRAQCSWLGNYLNGYIQKSNLRLKVHCHFSFPRDRATLVSCSCCHLF
jgi:hypothetical protein